jgi:hypothetical protein
MILFGDSANYVYYGIFSYVAVYPHARACVCARSRENA